MDTLRSRTAIFALLAACAPLAATTREVVAVNVDSIVHPVTVDVISRAAEQARTRNAAFLLIRLNTPGGLGEAMRQAVEKIVASPVPVVTYVTPAGGRAASAGFFLLEAGDVAAMTPGTATGAAHPVLLGTQMDPVMKQKLEQDAAASLRSVVGKRGRNSALAEKAVFESKSFTDKEALENKLIDLVARDERDLLAQLDGREVTRFNGARQTLHTSGAVIVEYEATLRQRLLTALSDPNVALVFLVLGALGIYVEFSSPGLIVPGVAGAIMALLGLSAISVLPINWLGATLLLLALALFILEAKFTSHGMLGSGGALAMVLGAVMLVDSPLPEMRIHWRTAVALALPFSVITILLVSLVVRARRNKVESGAEAMVGEIGVALSALDPEGKVFVHGEYWDARSSAPVAAGDRIRVTALDKLKLMVEPAGKA